MVVEKLQKACEKREAIIEKLGEEGTNCYRLFSADADGIPGWVIERFGSVGIFQFHQGKCELSIADLKIAGRWCLNELGLKQIYLKRFLADRTSGAVPEELLSSTPFVGEEPSAACFPVTENGITFLIRPYDGFSVGLFLDQRLNRRLLGQSGKPGRKVLNLFSYTCAFSVYCAKQGAEVTSVDVSSKYLDWGKENYAANGLSLENQRFFVADARYFLRAAIKRQERYDQIVLDPPSFARGKKNEPFSVRRNLGEILDQCGQVLTPGGTLFVSTNFSQWEDGDLEKIIRGALGDVEYLNVPGVPEDYGRGATPIVYRYLRRD